jgi:methyl-accepting chemotaxis protein
VDEISKGNIPAKITDNYNGDFNTIKNNLNTCIDALGGLLESGGLMRRMALNDYSTDVQGTFPGIFGELCTSANEAQSRIRHAVDISQHIAIGNFRTDLEALKKIGRRSEKDALMPAYVQMMEAIAALVDDAESLSKAAVEGRLATRADASKHGGDYRKVVEGVNATLDAVIGPLSMSADYMDKISKGNIPAKITDNYNGDFNTIKNNLNTCIDAIGALVTDANMLVKAAVEGKLTTRADASKHGGDFGKIVDGVNATLDAVVGPLTEVGQVLDKMAGGDLTIQIVSDYAGDFNRLKTTVNTLATQVRSAMQQIGTNANTLVSAAEELNKVSQQMSASADETATQANVVSAASEQVASNVQTVATGADEMGASIKRSPRTRPTPQGWRRRL